MPKEKYNVIMTEFDDEVLEFWFPKTEEELEKMLKDAEITQENREADIERLEDPSIVPEKDEGILLQKEKDTADLLVQLVKDELKVLEGKR